MKRHNTRRSEEALSTPELNFYQPFVPMEQSSKSKLMVTLMLI
ncbi:MAG: hypothetical protein ABI237_10310 [Ginsengibacter sp.]